ncbi:MAG: mechanosensitive ion channel family protein [Sulfurimonas sp.]
MRVVFLFLLFTLSLFAKDQVKYSPFIDKQIEITYKLNDANLSEEEATKLLHLQTELYEKKLNDVMMNKNEIINHVEEYKSEIFSLKRIIRINQRAGNTYAVLRDTVQIKNYKIVRNINYFIRDVLIALDAPTLEEFDKRIDQLVQKKQQRLKELIKEDYKEYLSVPDNGSKVIHALKENIRELYALKQINNDISSYVYKFEGRMYRLNKFSKYKIIKPVIYLNSIDAVQSIDRLLNDYHLSFVKILIILFLVVIIYIFRKLFYIVLHRYLINSKYLNEYAEEIIVRTKKTIELLIIVINIDMIIYVYNDFSSVELINKMFNMIYVALFTYFVYIVVNTIAVLNLNKLVRESSSVKAELINVGIKIINFFIFTIGVLFVLYFAGVDLTAVLSGLGIGGFAVAFAAKDTISNFFGTLSILFSNVFSQGDWIEIDGKEGVVVEIGLRVTTLRTFDNALIAIPNGTFAAKDIKNWDKRKLGRRIKMKLGVKYDSKREDINNAIVQIREMLQNHPEIATKDTKYEHARSHRSKRMVKLVSQDDLEGIKRTLLVFLDEFSDSSINILIYCFSKSVKWEDWLRVKQDVMEKIMVILEQNNLEFAFPSLSIYDETKCDQNS